VWVNTLSGVDSGRRISTFRQPHRSHCGQGAPGSRSSVYAWQRRHHHQDSALAESGGDAWGGEAMVLMFTTGLW
jgi:hypothetical protein